MVWGLDLVGDTTMSIKSFEQWMIMCALVAVGSYGFMKFVEQNTTALAEQTSSQIAHAADVLKGE